MATKRRNTGATIHTTAEFVRTLKPGELHEVACPHHKERHWETCTCPHPKPPYRGRIVRVTHNGTSHERLLYEIEKRKPLFVFPRSDKWENHSPYVPMHKYMHRISASSCGVDLWPKGREKNDLAPLNHGALLKPWQQAVRGVWYFECIWFATKAARDAHRAEILAEREKRARLKRAA